MTPTYPKLYEEPVLPGFSYFRYLTRAGVDLATVADFGYQQQCRPLFNAFARRLRIAVAFQSAQFEGFTEETAETYAALNKHFLMYTAFERYVYDCEGILNGAYHKAFKTLDDTFFDEIKVFYDGLSNKTVIFDFLYEQCQSKIQRQSLVTFKNGFSSRHGIYLSTALRNAFSHGLIPAHIKGTQPGDLKKLCLFLSTFLHNALCTDFNNRLKSFENK